MCHIETVFATAIRVKSIVGSIVQWAQGQEEKRKQALAKKRQRRLRY